MHPAARPLPVVPDYHPISSRGENRDVLNTIFLVVTAIIAYHGLTWRDENGESDIVRLLFGTIALLFFFRVLLVDVLGVWG